MLTRCWCLLIIEFFNPAAPRTTIRLFNFVLSLYELLDQLGQRGEFLPINQVKLIDKVYEVLETSVQVGLGTQQHDVLEMGMVDVCVDTEKSFEYYFYDI